MIAQVMKMDKLVAQGLLYDFYGELLTDHQRAVYEDVVLRDYSLSEIAKEQGISRQGVHDLIRRCDRLCRDMRKSWDWSPGFTGRRSGWRRSTG